ncbi:MAG TPA: trypsin-like peptidase domain-containing protein, partial [Candidatus Bathyarchaeia archaeon]|nr:trypsin-like peptidase domain-containing protein [Candidatus Bathyarchaeia archaeon]
VITKDDQEYKVTKIFRDPSIDLAILQVSAKDLKPVELGDSEKLKVGQFVIAIGTALGEFRNTVTTGVISGLGRGVTAGDPFGGYSEELENVIQTDAAINPGNSGGPLLNSFGQVIGVNVATTAGAENIGFAIPINIVKTALDDFNKTGRFERPFLGVRYQIISLELALLNEVPEGAYVVEVIDNSPAQKAGVKKGDVITKIDGQKIDEKKGGLAKIIQSKKIGERVKLEVWRDGKGLELEVTLEISQ